MFAILIKDRGFPVHLYLQQMMKVMNVSRADAAIKLGEFAFKAGLKETDKAPLNNTMSDWLRNPQKTPQWAVVSCTLLLEMSGRVPQTNQEWAFWATASTESDAEKKVPAHWPANEAFKWLEKARTHAFWYNQRSAIKQSVTQCSSPLLAAKVIYTILGEGVNSVRFPDIFFAIDDSLLGKEQIASSIRNEVSLSSYQVEHVRLNDKKAHQSYHDIKQQLLELASVNILEISSTDDITVNNSYISNFMRDRC